MATVHIHLTDGTTVEHADVEERPAHGVMMAVTQTDSGQLRLLGRMYDRENIASVDVDHRRYR